MLKRNFNPEEELLDNFMMRKVLGAPDNYQDKA